MNTYKLSWAGLIAAIALGLFASASAVAQSAAGYYRRDSDEASRQRMMNQFRADATRTERRLNEIRSNSASSGSAARSGSGSSSNSSSAGSVSPLSGFSPTTSDDGPRAIESTTTETVRVRETEAETAGRIVREAAAGQLESMWNAGRLLFAGGFGGVKRDDSQALGWFRKAAAAGHPGAATALGEALLFGYGTAAQPAEAMRWLRQGAEGGVPRAQVHWGSALFSGEGGVVPDRAAARRWMETAAQAGEPHAQWLIGSERRRGGEWPRDTAEARRLLGLAAAQNHVLALIDLAEMSLAGEGVTKDLAQARRLFTAAANQDDPSAMTNAALMAFRGEGGPADPAQATAWLRAAAGRLNHANAQYSLGSRLMEGAGMQRDVAESVQWLSRAAAQKQRDALGIYGAMLYWGDGVPQEWERGLAMLREGAQAGSILAAEQLGDAFFEQRAQVPGLLPEAARWNRVAAEAGRWGGMLRWGLALRHGWGVPADPSAGCRWIRQAAERGMEAARPYVASDCKP